MSSSVTNKPPHKINRKFLVSAPGKVILFGEHAVVFGKSAVASSVGLRSYLYLETREEELLELYLPELGATEPFSWKKSELTFEFAAKNQQEKGSFNQILYEKVKFFTIDKINKNVEGNSLIKIQQQQAAVSAFLYLYLTLLHIAETEQKQEQFGLTIRVRSTLPVGAGLGSSASYSVCLATGLLLSFGFIDISNTNDNRSIAESINHWAFQAETVLHGTPSGVDNTVATFGGVLKFTKGSSGHLMIENLKGSRFQSTRFLLIDTKIPRDTRTLVANVRVKLEKYPDIVNPILDAIQNISLYFVNLLKDHVSDNTFLEKFQDLIDLNHHLLNSLGVGHLALDKIREITARHGLHSKLTGAGGGGCALTLLHDDVLNEVIKRVKIEVSELGFDCFETLVGGPGVGVIDSLGVIDVNEFVTMEKSMLQKINGWHFYE
ncbi:10791_t:CDS:10 [Ambispora leptoticha]|uniref:Mevalonate kinase n=1 Tax=Ambispora leptoticha TaxID=144679 RepID=A0A9N9ADC9_9GLOM|nr:10791_t:CDS:10 [Ambispora leptoticha]